MRFVDLFAGFGGFTCGAERAGGELDDEERKELLREVFEARRALDALAAPLTRGGV